MPPRLPNVADISAGLEGAVFAEPVAPAVDVQDPDVVKRSVSRL